jgi:hypothetical protein
VSGTTRSPEARLMTNPTSSTTKNRGPVSRIARRCCPFPRLHHRRQAAPPPTGPVFRKVWKEVAPGQWQELHIYDEADQKK